MLQTLIHCRYELSVDLPELARLIKMDPALCFEALRLDRCMETADQTVGPFNIDATVGRIGMAGVDAIISQFLSGQVLNSVHHQRGQALQWLRRHALATALLSQTLAKAANCGAEEEAYTAGLLHSIGKLTLLARTPAACIPMLSDPAQAVSLLEAEEQVAGSGQERIGADLIRRFTHAWSAADAAAFQTASETQIRQALPMVQIIWAASRLAVGTWPASPVPETVSDLLEIDLSELGRISQAAEAQVKAMAEELGPLADVSMPDRAVADDPDPLIEAIQTRTASAHIYQELLQVEDPTAVMRVLRRSLNVFLGIEALMLFDHTPRDGCLTTRLTAGIAAPCAMERMCIPLSASDCLPVGCHSSDTVVDTFSRNQQNQLTIIDRQLLAALGTDGFVCLPFFSGASRGCLIVGIDAHEWPWSPQQKALLAAMAAAAGEALFRMASRSEQAVGRPSDRDERIAPGIRRIVHEINNPLSIIKNYLKVLARRAEQEQPVVDHIRIINEEIDRVGTLVRSLTQPADKKPDEMKIVDVNATIKDILILFGDDLSGETAIRIDEDLDPRIPAIRTDRDRLKQTLMNLLKNAAEAMPDGGRVTVRTRILHGLPRNTNGQAEAGYIKISVCDDGPGIDEGLQKDLFKPHVTSKAGHAGLGLSIVYEAMRHLNGTLLCESAPGRVTCFHIELPASDNDF